jgi:FkbM family methyltransferase
MYVDRYRFPHGRKYVRRPLPAVGEWPEIIAGHNAFEDSESRALFRALFMYRFASPRWSAVTRNREMADALDAFMMSEEEPSSFSESPHMLGERVGLWPANYNGIACRVATTRYGLYWTVVSDQYYFRRGGVYVGPERGDVVIDCGACLGDTAVKFAAHVGLSGHVYSFDPLPLHARIARGVARLNGLEGAISAYCCGVDVTTRPDIDAALSDTRLLDGRELLPGRKLDSNDAAISIDDFAARLDRVDLIKMDIEGSEAEALAGAGKTISRFRPKLQICVYHRPHELWTIPLAVKRRYPFYRLFLGHHSLHLEETVMYAINARAAP